MEWITHYGWIIWLVLILAFITIEMLSLEFTFLMIAIGSLIGMLSGFVGAPWWLQLLIAAAASVLLLLLVRPPLLRALHKGEDPTKSNIAALIGMGGRVVSTVDAVGGQVKLANGETWTARIAEGSLVPSVAPGTPVTVLSIHGATALVAPTEGDPS
ncbi:Membrane protein implicated in regulation of membrane protease activity [Paramicrobacterium humi]|uniref:Membrane protein implicated in regulation of membrane protease activity n=1 Tax=Paramicrobacterium humi TaxID=640635 RepID=A0A1H4R5V1_9MICO|nr:NfeD family protein [Microbacterium humi]SEC27206.1 Membrane protein implicated in regulation of membrane protease activity [Microbacterium humi]